MPIRATETSFIVAPGGGLRGRLRMPGDKSVSHRAVILGSLAAGETVAEGFLDSEDCLNTARCFQRLGVRLEVESREPGRAVLRVQGQGPEALREPEDLLDSGNSGTGFRLMAGVLAGLPFFTCLTGDDQVRQRPMGRIVDPLRQMGARIWGRQGGRLAPLAIQGGELDPIEYVSPVASAQVKSAILLAGLSTDGITSVQEPDLSRDHTEQMLKAFGAHLETRGTRVFLRGRQPLVGQSFAVPGDLSSAAFLVVGALITPDSDLVLEGVGINPTRTGLLDVLCEMGADLQLGHPRLEGGERVADLHVRTSELRGVDVSGGVIPRLIDEVPILALAASQARGETIIRDAAELRVKETDRVETTLSLLRALGADAEGRPDGLRIAGGSLLHGAACESYGDHRIAMTAAIAGLIAQGETTVLNTACTRTSFPGFPGLLAQAVGG